ncbi:calcium permeable stress-gated cation channel 1-like isoform X2 [Ptychodera flava]|uniref:calcium permeable stress-gated cation channel 1-like isoform X2 n=1 Tax=Ptychodera flava TaxID=63121 RepID=UPI00396A766C
MGDMNWNLMSTGSRCDIIGSNGTALGYLLYGGIPQNLGFNILCWVIVLLLFAVCRKIAGDYGRIALVQRADERATGYNVWTQRFFGDHSKDEGVKPINDVEGEETPLRLPHQDDQGFCAWIPSIFKIKDEHIRAKSGVDAVQYISFQRYILLLLVVLCVLSLCVILPVNFSGSQEGGPQNFGRTTVSNLPTDSPLLWVHTVFSVLYLVIVLAFMRHFTTHLQHREEHDIVTRTLFVVGVPLERTDPALVKQHFQEAYPDVIVTEIQFAYDITKLMKLNKKKQNAHQNRLHCMEMHQKTGIRPTLRAGTCGQVSCCDGCGGPKVDAIEYYAELEAKYTEEVMEERRIAYSSNLGMAFVTVHNEKIAAKIVQDYKTLKTTPPTISSVSTQLNSTRWKLDYAPAPDNIKWENLSVSPAQWWLRIVIINLVLCVFLFFITTPAVILAGLDDINYQKAFENLHSPFVSQFLPTLLLWTFSALLPVLVYWSSQFEAHWTRTDENHMVMRKTFIFLLFMLLILPSLGLTSAQAFFEWSLKNEEEIRMRWNCIFLPDNGAFFVNYVITCAVAGTALELFRFPELFYYACNMLWTRSEAEKITKRQELAYEFQFGVQYAWTLCIISIVMVYSITCPLIVPFGLVYMVLKHLVDRYNIYYAYGPSRIDKGIHDSAVNYVIISAVFLQCSMLFFSVIRLGSLDPRTIVSAVVLILILGLLIARSCFNVWMGFIPHSYQEFTNLEEPVPQEEEPTNFVPDVLHELEDKKEEGEESARHAAPPRLAYGATTSGEYIPADVSNKESASLTQNME